MLLLDSLPLPLEHVLGAVNRRYLHQLQSSWQVPILSHLHRRDSFERGIRGQQEPGQA